eukprot:5117565-Amphidinium_carterae.1
MSCAFVVQLQWMKSLKREEGRVDLQLLAYYDLCGLRSIQLTVEEPEPNLGVQQVSLCERETWQARLYVCPELFCASLWISAPAVRVTCEAWKHLAQGQKSEAPLQT